MRVTAAATRQCVTRRPYRQVDSTAALGSTAPRRDVRPSVVVRTRRLRAGQHRSRTAQALLGRYRKWSRAPCAFWDGAKDGHGRDAPVTRSGPLRCPLPERMQPEPGTGGGAPDGSSSRRRRSASLAASFCMAWRMLRQRGQPRRDWTGRGRRGVGPMWRAQRGAESRECRGRRPRPDPRRGTGRVA